jgi:hypothetical protein
MSRGKGPRRIDQVLAQAEVLADEYEDFDEQTGLERIARRVLWDSALSLEKQAHWIRSQSEAVDRPSTPDGHPQPGQGDGAEAVRPAWLAVYGLRTALHERATYQLGALSAQVIRDRSAVAAMGLLVDDPRRIEPDGALAFACLLYLADREDAARFWWQFAAGADSATAAFCLYLHHLQHSELRDAQHWQDLVTELIQDHAPAWGLPTPLTLADQPGVNTYHVFAQVPAIEVQPAVNTVVDFINSSCSWKRGHIRLSSELADAVYRLEVCSDADYGAIPRPDPDLAAELEGCAGPGQ